MSIRKPGEHMVMMYGGPSIQPTIPEWTPPDPPLAPVAPDFYSPLIEAIRQATEAAARTKQTEVKHKLRISTRVESDGELKLKVYVDDELVYEASSSGTTITVETNV